MANFNSIKEGIESLKRGELIVLVDGLDRENEGDLCCAAEKISPEKVNFMATHGKGLICLSITDEIIKKLGLSMMVSNNKSRFETNFTVSIEAAQGITTGISAYDRAHTIKTAIDDEAGFHSVAIPGHIFPILAKPGGVLQRAGHTEGSVDLARLAGLKPTGVICEIMKPDGTMAKRDDLFKFAEKHKLVIINIEDLIQYRLQEENCIKEVGSTQLPTQYGDFMLHGFQNTFNDEQCVALTKGKWEKGDTVLTRMHSECLTGEVFSSLRCDCQPQLQKAMQIIQKEGQGAIVYLRQEGRGIGILNKIKAYHLQDLGLDTLEANEKLGFKGDLREYGFGAQVLIALKIYKLKLLTNNPRKIIGLHGFGIEVVERISIETDPTTKNLTYLKTKKEKMGHILKFTDAKKP